VIHTCVHVLMQNLLLQDDVRTRKTSVKQLLQVLKSLAAALAQVCKLRLQGLALKLSLQHSRIPAGFQLASTTTHVLSSAWVDTS
jgi:hypothetical protein